MSLLTKSFCTFLLLHALNFPSIKAQPTERDGQVHDSAYAVAVRQYHAYVSPQTNLYRGPQYVDYTHEIKTGQPFFEADSLMWGSVLYNGILYQHLLLRYDLVLGVVVLPDPYNEWKIGLNSEYVDSFTLDNHIFVHLRDSLNPTAPRNGLYEQLYKGRNWLLKREVKKVQTEPSFLDQGFQKYVSDEISYYLKKGTVYYPVNSRRALYFALKDRSRQVKKFIRSNRLSLRNDKENSLVKIITWYDGPTL